VVDMAVIASFWWLADVCQTVILGSKYVWWLVFGLTWHGWCLGWSAAWWLRLKTGYFSWLFQLVCVGWLVDEKDEQ